VAHRLKVVVRPHTNKDGSISKTRKDYEVIDRTRKQRLPVGLVHNKKDLDLMTGAYWESVHLRHLRTHPNDKAFLAKHPELKA
jgi:hypothetical protein